MAARIVGTRLNYCNALLHGDTEKSLNQLQRVRKKLARVVCNVITRQRHTADVLCNLHWLPTQYQIHSIPDEAMPSRISSGSWVYVPIAGVKIHRLTDLYHLPHGMDNLNNLPTAVKLFMADAATSIFVWKCTYISLVIVDKTKRNSRFLCVFSGRHP